MQIVYQWFQKLVQNYMTWYYHFTISEAEINKWCEEQERQWAEEEAEEARWFAEYLQQQKQQVLTNKQAEAEEYDRQLEESRRFYEEMQEREELNEFLSKEREEYEYRCPLCGRPWVCVGRCKPCNRAFGRD